jgi:hypothetical protein
LLRRLDPYGRQTAAQPAMIRATVEVSRTTADGGMLIP